MLMFLTREGSWTMKIDEFEELSRDVGEIND